MESHYISPQGPALVQVIKMRTIHNCRRKRPYHYQNMRLEKPTKRKKSKTKIYHLSPL